MKRYYKQKVTICYIFSIRYSKLVISIIWKSVTQYATIKI